MGSVAYFKAYLLRRFLSLCQNHENAPFSFLTVLADFSRFA